jgi:hypothetical protein
MVYFSFTHLRCYTKILELDFGIRYIGYMNFEFLEIWKLELWILNFKFFHKIMGIFFTSVESMGF